MPFPSCLGLLTERSSLLPEMKDVHPPYLAHPFADPPSQDHGLSSVSVQFQSFVPNSGSLLAFDSIVDRWPTGS